jgi:serine/threonine-protein kinase
MPSIAPDSAPQTPPCPVCARPIPPAAPLAACPHCLLAAGLATGLETTAATEDTPAAPAPAELAQEFPGLDLIELLGRGGMGAVYKARQRDLDRMVALKILRPGLDHVPGFSDKFTREARALARLNHPGIVTLYEFGRTPAGRYFILMEFVDGVNLGQLLSAGRLSPREALAIVPPLCDALQYAHDQGLVHCDIKPENLLIDRLGRVKIADFGIARLGLGNNPEAPAAGKEIIGTPAYMAPEQHTAPDTIDHRADLYALGVVFYQMLTGELPPDGPLRAPSTRVPIDVKLDEIVLRALEKKPALRYANATELKTEIETLIRAGDTRGQTPASPARPAPDTAPDRHAAPDAAAALPLLPAALLILLMTFFCGSLMFSADNLPEVVAVHFDISGQADAWAERGVSLLVLLVAGVGIPLFVGALFIVLRFLPPYLLELPNRDFWLAPARRAWTHARLLRHGL